MKAQRRKVNGKSEIQRWQRTGALPGWRKEENERMV